MLESRLLVVTFGGCDTLRYGLSPDRDRPSFNQPEG